NAARFAAAPGISLPRTSSAVFPLVPPSYTASITRSAVGSAENGNTLAIVRRLIFARSDRENVPRPRRLLSEEVEPAYLRSPGCPASTISSGDLSGGRFHARG